MTLLHTLRRSRAVFSGIALLLAGCAGEQTQTTEEAVPETAVNTQPAAPLPTTFIYISHPVSDFDVWMAAYEAFDSVRSEQQISEIWVYRDLDQEGVVHVLHGATDVESAQAFVGMEQLAEAMAAAGVIGKPRIDLMRLVDGTQPKTIPESHYNLLVAHEIEDWDTWKAAYDAHMPARDAAQLSSRGVARGVDNPNMIYINFAVGDLDAARAFAASDDLKSVMAGAGVVGAPEIYFAETAKAM